MEPIGGTSRDTGRADATAAVLARLDARLARIEAQIERASKDAPNAVAMAVDTFDDLCERAQARGIDLDSRARNLVDALEKLTSPSALRVLGQLLDRVSVVEGFLASGMLEAQPVAIVSRAGAALAETGRSAPRSMTGWQAFRALADRRVQRALGFAVEFARRFGEALEDEARALPPAGETSRGGER